MSMKYWSLGVGALVAGLLMVPGGTRAENKDLPGPIDSVEDLQDTGKMVFKMADVNNDGQISQKEATDAGNLLVGGFFFRADPMAMASCRRRKLSKPARRSYARSRSCGSSWNERRREDRRNRVSLRKRVREMPRRRTRSKGS